MCLSFYSLHSRQVEYFNGINVTKRELLRSHLQSEMFNLPISTLRYYDEKGLFPTMQRDSGIRKFGERELEAEIERMNRVLDMLRFKCWYYEQAIRDGNENRLSRLQPEEMPEDIRRAYEHAHSMDE